jgi:nucleoside-diphosphate-sugar epimerase
MRVGIIGLGHIGYSIASRMHSSGHEIYSWTRSKKIVPWENSTELNVGVDHELDSLFIASGGARPNSGNFDLEIATTFDLVSKFSLSKKTKLYYISSGAVYGECDAPRSEIHKPEPKTNYGKVKLMAEQKLQTTYRDQLSILRVGNIIDEENPYGIVAHLSTSIKNGVFAAYGKPTDCRDYLSISDFQFCIERLIELDHQPKLLNLGSGKSISLEEIVHLLIDALDTRIDVQWGQRRFGDLSQTRLDVSQMRRDLKSNPENPTKKIKALIKTLVLSNHLRD